MNKWSSFGWGVLVSLVGGIFVAILLYFLYLKKKKVNVLYYGLGFVAIAVIMFIVIGTAIGIMQYFIEGAIV